MLHSMSTFEKARLLIEASTLKLGAGEYILSAGLVGTGKIAATFGAVDSDTFFFRSDDLKADTNFKLSLQIGKLGSSATHQETLTIKAIDTAPHKINGTEKADSLKGTAKNDIIDAKGGPDKVSNSAGKDMIKLGAGDDHAFFQTQKAGFDTDLYLGTGRDTIHISDALVGSSKPQHVDVFNFGKDDAILIGNMNATKNVLTKAVDKGDYHQYTANGITIDIHGAENLFPKVTHPVGDFY